MFHDGLDSGLDSVDGDDTPTALQSVTEVEMFVLNFYSLSM